MPFSGLVDPAGRVAIRVEPPHAEAYCTITKAECSYPRIMLAYDLVEDWVRSAGLPSVSAVREIYFADFRHIPGTAPAVDIAQPVERNAR